MNTVALLPSLAPAPVQPADCPSFAAAALAALPPAASFSMLSLSPHYQKMARKDRSWGA